MPRDSHEKAAVTCLSVSAQQLLQSQTLDELTASIASGVAELICNHEAEHKSMHLTLMSSLPFRAAPFLVFTGLWLNRRFSYVSCFSVYALLKSWQIWQPQYLTRQQEYEADAVAAANSAAAGCSPDCRLTSIQRTYVVERNTPQRKLWPQRIQQRSHWQLLQLQKLLPNSQIPTGEFKDSKDLD